MMLAVELLLVWCYSQPLFYTLVSFLKNLV